MLKSFNEMVTFQMKLSDFNELLNNASLREDSERRNSILFLKQIEAKKYLQELLDKNSICDAEVIKNFIEKL